MFILILHDWCSSGNRFVKLKNDLTSDGHRLVVMPFPGMGLESAVWDRDIIDHYSGSVASYMKHNSVDCIIAHGMGCTVASRALWLLCSTKKVWTGKLILINPYYKGLKRLGRLLWIRRLSTALWREMIGNSGAARRWCRMYVHDTAYVDDMMISDLRAADSDTALSALDELVRDKDNVSPTLGRTYLICGSKDGLIRRKLIKEMGRCLNAEDIHWCSCGHYPMVECYGEFLQVIRRYLDA